MTALPPPSRDPLLPGADRGRPTAAGRPLPPPGSKQPSRAATASARPAGTATEARLAALQHRRQVSGRPGARPATATAPRGDRGPVKAATIARWRRTWRSRLVATAGAAAGLIGGTAVIAHSLNADKATTDTQTASQSDTFEDVTTVPAPTATPVVTAAPTVGTLPPTSAAATTTATTAAPVAATEATVPATTATAATVPATQAPATSRATTATTARPRTTTPARTRQQQPASRSSGS